MEENLNEVFHNNYTFEAFLEGKRCTNLKNVKLFLPGIMIMNVRSSFEYKHNKYKIRRKLIRAMSIIKF